MEDRRRAARPEGGRELVLPGRADNALEVAELLSRAAAGLARVVAGRSDGAPVENGRDGRQSGCHASECRGARRQYLFARSFCYTSFFYFLFFPQLCVALAHLALQMGSWKNAAVDIASRHNALRPCFTLELLTVLAEEVNSRTLRLGANRRSEIYKEFSENLPAVNQLLELCLTSEADNERVKIQSYKCFASWVNIRSISLSQVLHSNVLSNAFSVLCSFDVSLFNILTV